MTRAPQPGRARAALTIACLFVAALIISGPAAIAQPTSATTAAKTLEHLPSCRRYKPDVCLHSVAILPRHDDVIIGQVELHTRKIPHAIEIYVALDRKVKGKWEKFDAVTYRKKDIPPPGRTKLMKVLEAHCVTGLWRLSFHAISVSSTGTAESIFLYVPGKRNNLSWAVFSSAPIRNTPGYKVKCIG